MPDAAKDIQRFLDTWAAHCGAPRKVFEGQFLVTLKRALDGQRARIVTLVRAQDPEQIPHSINGCDDCCTEMRDAISDAIEKMDA